MICSYAFMMRKQGSQAGEASIDALHASPLVGVGDFPPDPLLLLHALAGLMVLAPASLLLVFFFLLFNNLKRKKHENLKKTKVIFL
jgi:hypothetical protein